MKKREMLVSMDRYGYSMFFEIALIKSAYKQEFVSRDDTHHANVGVVLGAWLSGVLLALRM